MKTLFALAVTLLFALFTYAQMNSPAKWVKISSNDDEFSVCVPADFIVFKNDQFGQVIVLSAAGNSSFEVAMGNTSGMSQFKELKKKPSEKEAVFEDYSVGDFKVAKYTAENKVFRITLYVASSRGYFSVSTVSKNADDQSMLTLIRSIRLNGKKLIKSDVGDIPVNANYKVSELKTSQIVKDVLEKKLNKPKEPNETDKKMVSEPIDMDVLYSRQFLMLKKDRPSYTDSARQNNVQGTVELRIQFRADGTIGAIGVVHGLPSGLTQEAVRAAKKIRFLSAEIDGKPVDVVRSVEYTFTIY